MASRSAPAPLDVGRLVRTLGVPYARGLALWYLLGHTEVSRWWLFQFADIFNPWFYLPLPLLMLAAWHQRDRRAGLWLVLPVVLFAADYGSLFLPRSGGAAEVHLRVLTANVEYMNREADSLASLLREQRPDVVALQELGTGLSGPLADRVRDLYPYQALRPSADTLGMGVLSRYPILDSTPAGMAPECRCQEVTLAVDGRTVNVINIHPAPPSFGATRVGGLVVPTGFSTEAQEQVVLGIVARARAAAGPVLILGDLNATDREDVYSILGESYHDAYREVGWGPGFTFPAWSPRFVPFYPLVRIDHIFHDDSWVAAAARVIHVPGSDHRGVMADLTLR